MDGTFNCHCNGSMIVSTGDEMHILFLISKPVLKDGKPEMQTEEQALISIPFGYGKVLGDAILKNYVEHLENAAKQAQKEASIE